MGKGGKGIRHEYSCVNAACVMMRKLFTIAVLSARRYAPGVYVPTSRAFG